MVRDRQEIKRCLYFDPVPVVGMCHRFALGETVRRIRVGGPVAQQVGVIGQVAVRVGIAPEQPVGKIRSLNRHKDHHEYKQAGYPLANNTTGWNLMHRLTLYRFRVGFRLNTAAHSGRKRPGIAYFLTAECHDLVRPDQGQVGFV